ncbi:MAG: site-specific integrase [Candidatus Latescibacterota bacterium]
MLRATPQFVRRTQTKDKPRWLDKEETGRLLEECPSHIYALVATALNTGLRRAELFHLEWSDVDFTSESITVRNKAEWHTKNYESRTIPMNSFLYGVLRKHPRRINSTFVFSNPEGKPWDNVRQSLSNAAERAGIGHLGLHALRHTFASQLVMAGVDLRTVQKWMGHKNIKTTMRYAHLAPSHERAAIEMLNLSTNSAQPSFREKKSTQAVSA